MVIASALHALSTCNERNWIARLNCMLIVIVTPLPSSASHFHCKERAAIQHRSVTLPSTM